MIDRDRAAQELGSSGPKCIFIETNVTKADDWKRLVSSTISHLGGLDVIVNNAGWTYTRTDALNVTEQEYDRTSESHRVLQ